jgi:SET domain-containing protein
MATKKTAPKKSPRSASASGDIPPPGTPRKATTPAGPRKAAKKRGAGKTAPSKAKKAGRAGKPAAPKAAKRAAKALKIAVRNSPIHGRGVYATADIAKGERVMEYRGEIISWKAADERPPSDPNDPHHTFLFSLSDGKKVIDASQKGNDARWINHSCDPNCETEETGSGRVFIEALRDIGAGEELNYDYCLIIDEKLTKTLKQQYACRCGAAKCRGTMLALPEKKKKKKKKRKH